VGWTGAEFGGEGCLGFEDDVIEGWSCVFKAAAFVIVPPRWAALFLVFYLLIRTIYFWNRGARGFFFTFHSAYLHTHCIYIYL
jgi:hypothetical protein